VSSKSSDIAVLLNVPACAHNANAASGCSRPKPAALAGGRASDEA
jgi:nitrogenase molybdenum-cofactor synthesis protein NifE